MARARPARCRRPPLPAYARRLGAARSLLLRFDLRWRPRAAPYASMRWPQWRGGAESGLWTRRSSGAAWTAARSTSRVQGRAVVQVEARCTSKTGRGTTTAMSDASDASGDGTPTGTSCRGGGRARSKGSLPPMWQLARDPPPPVGLHRAMAPSTDPFPTMQAVPTPPLRRTPTASQWQRRAA